MLVYLTGLDQIPVLGFDTHSVEFGHPDNFIGDHTSPFPVVNTSILQLSLPILSSYAEFRENFSAALMAAQFSQIFDVHAFGGIL